MPDNDIKFEPLKNMETDKEFIEFYKNTKFFSDDDFLQEYCCLPHDMVWDKEGSYNEAKKASDRHFGKG